MRLPTIFLAAALLAPPTPAAAAPQSGAKKESAFGFTKGMTLKQVQAVAKVEKLPGYAWVYSTKKPPAPVGYFDHYVIAVSPKVGVCRVMASTEHVRKDSPPIKNKIERITEAISAKYGPWSARVSRNEGEFVAVRRVEVLLPRAEHTLPAV
jgi:hypothetical protein